MARKRRGAKKLRLFANSETQVAKPAPSIRVEDGEVALSKKAMRPPGRKPRKIARGKLSLRLDWRPMDPTASI